MCTCDRLHVDELGPVGVFAAGILELGMEVFQRRNGDPPIPGQFTDLVKLLAAGSARAPRFGRISGAVRFTTSEAASALNVSPGHVRRLATSGRFAGARRQGRDWLIPVDAIEDYRKARRDTAA